MVAPPETAHAHARGRLAILLARLLATVEVVQSSVVELGEPVEGFGEPVVRRAGPTTGFIVVSVVHLAEIAGGVARVAQPLGHGQSVRGEGAALEPARPPAGLVATADQAGSGRRTDRRRDIGLAQGHALGSESVEGGRRHRRAEVAPAGEPVVVGEEQQDVGAPGTRAAGVCLAGIGDAHGAPLTSSLASRPRHYSRLTRRRPR